MKRATKKATLPKSPQSNLFKLEFNNFPQSWLLIDSVELSIDTGYIDGEKHLNINFTCNENEWYQAFDYFASLALTADAWEIARLVVYNSNGDGIKTINMSVKVKSFNKRLSFHNSDPIKYDISGIFKLEY